MNVKLRRVSVLECVQRNRDSDETIYDRYRRSDDRFFSIPNHGCSFEASPAWTGFEARRRAVARARAFPIDVVSGKNLSCVKRHDHSSKTDETRCPVLIRRIWSARGLWIKVSGMVGGHLRRGKAWKATLKNNEVN
jgi:hypothetical protein